MKSRVALIPAAMIMFFLLPFSSGKSGEYLLHPRADAFWNNGHWNPYPTIYRWQRLSSNDGDTNYIDEAATLYMYAFNPESLITDETVDSIMFNVINRKTLDEEVEIRLVRGYSDEGFFVLCDSGGIETPWENYEVSSWTMVTDPCTGLAWNKLYINHIHYGFGVKTYLVMGGSHVRVTEAYIVVYTHALIEETGRIIESDGKGIMK